MDMLGVLRVSGSKEEKARHAQFIHNIPEVVALRKSHRHTLAVPLNPLKGCADIPGKRATPLPNDVHTANPAVGESGAEKART
jgi:hypothetical protein